jgi:hypothetical protein
VTAKFMTLEESRASGWAYYQHALKGQDYPIHPHHAPIGFFRKWNRHKDKSWPVAIWEDQGKKFAQIGDGAMVDISSAAAEQDFINDTFQWCSTNAIPYTAYEFWKANRDWPPESGAAEVIKASKAARTEAAGIGHNSGEDPAVEHEIFVDQVKAALAGVKALKTVTSDEQAAEATSLRNRLTELATEGGKKHAVEKKPHLDAGRAVDQRWNPVINDAKDGATALRRAIEDFKTAELRKRREAEAAAAAAANPVTEAPAKEQITPAYGKRASVKPKMVPVRWDQDQVYLQLRDNPEIQQLIEKLVKKVYAAGGTLRTVETEEFASIR